MLRLKDKEYTIQTNQETVFIVHHFQLAFRVRLFFFVVLTIAVEGQSFLL